MLYWSSAGDSARLTVQVEDAALTRNNQEATKRVSHRGCVLAYVGKLRIGQGGLPELLPVGCKGADQGVQIAVLFNRIEVGRMNSAVGRSPSKRVSWRWLPCIIKLYLLWFAMPKMGNAGRNCSG